MPISHIEKKESREIIDGPNPSATLVYRFKGSNDESAILTYARTNYPATFLGLSRDELNVRPAGNMRWMGYASYNLRPNDNAQSFETGGGSSHIKHSLATIASYAATGAGTPPDFQRAINCDGQQVGGADITIPVFNFTQTKTFPIASVNTAFMLTLFNATGKTNNASYKGFAAGEVLFLGASGSQRGTEKYQVTARWAASPNLSGLSIGTITGISKAGWDYLWVYFADDVSNNTLIKKPFYAFVEQVYKPTDLSAIGFGA